MSLTIPMKIPSPEQDKDSFIQAHTFDLKRGRPSPEAVCESVRMHGLAILRNCLNPSGLQEPLAALNQWYLTTRQDNADGKHNWRFENGTNLPSERFIQFIAGSYYTDVAKAYYGCSASEVLIPTNRIMLRIRDEYTNAMLFKTNGVHNFHQDYVYVPHGLALNAWVPLTKVDAQCMGLSFVLPFTGEVYSPPPDIHKIMQETNGFIIMPKMDIGDMILFNHKTLHGTFNTLEKKGPRMSIEFRSGTSKAMGPGKIAKEEQLLQFPGEDNYFLHL